MKSWQKLAVITSTLNIICAFIYELQSVFQLANALPIWETGVGISSVALVLLGFILWIDGYFDIGEDGKRGSDTVKKHGPIKRRVRWFAYVNIGNLLTTIPVAIVLSGVTALQMLLGLWGATVGISIIVDLGTFVVWLIEGL